jgi:hydrogenase-4 component E
VLLAGTRSIGREILLVAAQAALIAASAAVVGIATGSIHLLAGAALTFVTKGIIVPIILRRILRRTPVRTERHPFVSPRVSMIAAVVIVFAAGLALGDLRLPVATDTSRVLSAAVAQMLTGLLIAMTRRKALSIVVGLLVFENGLSLTAFSLTYGMPFVVELGIAFDLLVAIVVSWVYLRRMLETFGSMSTDELRSLRG